jgi:hypothetical protein
MKKIPLTSILILLSLTINAQDNWETYLIKKEKGLMAISVNMDLNVTKPNYKNLLIIGTNTRKCFKNGYPNQDGLEDLYIFSDSVAKAIDKVTKSRLAGIITYQCVGLDVFYVKDTLNLRQNIQETINNNFSQSKNYTVIERDKKWDYYHNNLYPKDLSEDFFMNQDFLRQLVEEGDDQAVPRELKHWIYFNNPKKRVKFISEVKKLDFAIDSVNYKKDKKFVDVQNSFYYSRVKSYPFEVKISRKDSINPSSISNLTFVLKEMAKSLNGKYDGWGLE